MYETRETLSNYALDSQLTHDNGRLSRSRSLEGYHPSSRKISASIQGDEETTDLLKTSASGWWAQPDVVSGQKCTASSP